MADTPLILLVLIFLLRVVGLLCSLVNFLVLLWLGVCNAFARRRKAWQEEGHRLEHALLWFPRWLFLTLAVPVWLGQAAGLGALASILTGEVYTGVVLAIGLFIASIISFVFVRVDSIAKKLFPRFYFFGKQGYFGALGDSFLDLGAFLSLLFSVLLIVRIPGLVLGLMAVARKDSQAKKTMRSELYFQLGMTFVDWLVMPFLVLQLILFWRIPGVYREWRKKASTALRFTRSLGVRQQVFLGVANGLLDVPCFIMLALLVFTPWRYKTVHEEFKMPANAELDKKRAVMLKQFGHGVIDMGVMILGCFVLVTVYRSIPMFARLKLKTSKRRYVVLKEFGLVFLDMFTLAVASLSIFTVYKLPRIYRKCIGPRRVHKWGYKWTPTGSSSSPSAQTYILSASIKVLRDLPFVVMAVIITLLLWRAYFLWKDLVKGSPTTYGQGEWRRKRVAHHFGGLFIDIIHTPFMVMGAIMLGSLWRARPFYQHMKQKVTNPTTGQPESKTRAHYRNVVLWQFILWLWDIPTGPALVILICTFYRAKAVLRDLKTFVHPESSSGSLGVTDVAAIAPTMADDDDAENPAPPGAAPVPSLPTAGTAVGGQATQTRRIGGVTWHRIVWSHFLMLLLDAPFPVLALLTCWRMPFLIKRIRSDECQTARERRVMVLRYLFLTLKDIPISVFVFLLFVTVWRFPSFIKLVKQYQRGDNEHKMVAALFLQLLVDLPFVAMGIYVACMPWRSWFFLKKVFRKDMSADDRRILALVYFVVCLTDVICIVISALLIITVCRAVSLFAFTKQRMNANKKNFTDKDKEKHWLETISWYEGTAWAFGLLLLDLVSFIQLLIIVFGLFHLPSFVLRAYRMLRLRHELGDKRFTHRTFRERYIRPLPLRQEIFNPTQPQQARKRRRRTITTAATTSTSPTNNGDSTYDDDLNAAIAASLQDQHNVVDLRASVELQTASASSSNSESDLSTMTSSSCTADTDSDSEKQTKHKRNRSKKQEEKDREENDDENEDEKEREKERGKENRDEEKRIEKDSPEEEEQEEFKEQKSEEEKEAKDIEVAKSKNENDEEAHEEEQQEEDSDREQMDDKGEETKAQTSMKRTREQEFRDYINAVDRLEQEEYKEAPFSLTFLRLLILHEFFNSVYHIPHLFLLPLKFLGLCFIPLHLFYKWRLHKKKKKSTTQDTEEELVTSAATPTTTIAVTTTATNAQPNNQAQLPENGLDNIRDSMSFLAYPIYWIYTVAQTRFNFWGLDQFLVLHCVGILALLPNELALLWTAFNSAIIFILTIGSPLWKGIREDMGWFGLGTSSSIWSIPDAIISVIVCVSFPFMLLLQVAMAILPVFLLTLERFAEFPTWSEYWDAFGSSEFWEYVQDWPWYYWLIQVAWLAVAAAGVHITFLHVRKFYDLYDPLNAYIWLYQRIIAGTIWRLYRGALANSTHWAYTHRHSCCLFGELAMFPIFILWAWWPIVIPFIFTSIWDQWYFLFLVPPLPMLFFTVKAYFIIKQNWRKRAKVQVNDDPIFKLQKVRPELPQSGGLVIHFTAAKPREFTLLQARVLFEGDEFWRVLGEVIGKRLVSTFKLALYPVTLCPTYMKANTVPAGVAVFSSRLEFFVQGQKRKVARSTLVKSMQKLIDAGDPEFKIVVEYGERKGGWKKHGILFTFTSRLSDWLEASDNNADLQLSDVDVEEMAVNEKQDLSHSDDHAESDAEEREAGAGVGNLALQLGGSDAVDFRDDSRADAEQYHDIDPRDTDLEAAIQASLLQT